MQNASDQNLKQNVHIKSCECECLYEDRVTSSTGDSAGKITLYQFTLDLEYSGKYIIFTEQVF